MKFANLKWIVKLVIQILKLKMKCKITLNPKKLIKLEPFWGLEKNNSCKCFPYDFRSGRKTNKQTSKHSNLLILRFTV